MRRELARSKVTCQIRSVGRDLLSIRWRLLPWIAAGLIICPSLVSASPRPPRTVASWYGEEHRGKLMANGKTFNPDRLTAASWFYALGTKVKVSSSDAKRRSVVVTITDRGPALDLVQAGRMIDLSHAAFKKIANPALGLAAVRLEVLR